MNKDPQAVLDFAWDWTAWLEAGETVTEATVTPEAGLSLAAGKPAPAPGNVVTAWLSGGTVGKRYAVTCHVKTSAGREDDRTIEIDVIDR